MRQYIFLFLAVLLTGSVHAAKVNQGDLILTNCFQRVSVNNTQGTIVIIAGQPMGFVPEIDDQISGVNLFDETHDIQGNPQEVPLGYFPNGTSFTPQANHTFKVVIVEGGPGSGGGTFLFNALPLDIIIHNPNDCHTFGDITFDPLFSGLCDWTYSITNTFSNHTFTSTGNYTLGANTVTIPDEGFCTPPQGEDWVGKMHCMQATVTMTIHRCDDANPAFCPESLTVTKPITICCNNCQPYNQPAGKRATSGITSTNEEAPSFNVYPNPASNSVTLQTPANSAITIYAVNGQVIAKISSPETTHNVNTKEWPAGIYTVRIEKEGQLIGTQKLNIVHP